MKTVHVDASKITDWESFYDSFAAAFGFPEFFGRNMDAWIDCMSSLDEEFNEIHVPPGELVCVALDQAQEFKLRCPMQYEAFVECSAFVNWRRLEAGEWPSSWCPSMSSAGAFTGTANPSFKRTCRRHAA